MVGKRQCCHCDPSTFQAQQLPLIWSHWPFCDTWTLQGTCLPWNNHMVFCWARSFPADQPGEFLPSKRTCSGSLIWDFSVKPLSYSPCSPAQSSPAVPLILSDLLPLLLSPASIWNNSPFCNLFLPLFVRILLQMVHLTITWLHPGMSQRTWNNGQRLERPQ